MNKLRLGFITCGSRIGMKTVTEKAKGNLSYFCLEKRISGQES